jgi:hypothetical protein
MRHHASHQVPAAVVVDAMVVPRVVVGRHQAAQPVN